MLRRLQGKPLRKLVPGTGVRTQIAAPLAAAPPPPPVFEEPKLKEEQQAPPTAAQPHPRGRASRPLPSIVARAEAAKSRIGPTAFGAPIGGAPSGPQLTPRRELSARGMGPVTILLIVFVIPLGANEMLFWAWREGFVNLDAPFGGLGFSGWQAYLLAATIIGALYGATILGAGLMLNAWRAKRSGGRNPKPRQQRKPPPVATTAHPRSANVETDRGTMLDALRHSFSRLSRIVSHCVV